jgi:predicted outer membrane lipoprotein
MSGPSDGSANSTTSALHVPQIHTHVSNGMRWTWDEPLQLLSIAAEQTASEEAGILLPLRSLRELRAALDRLRESDLALVERALAAAAAELELWEGLPPWPAELSEAMGLLLMFLMAADTRLKPGRLRALARAAAKRLPWRRRYNARRLRAAARTVADLLPAQSPAGAWRVRFQKSLSPAHRAAILATASSAEVRIPRRELVWWTAQCRLDHAVEWCTQHVEDGEAARELTDAVAAYIALLQGEHARREMESFYRELGTTSEREVLRALAERRDLTGCDEPLRADVATWLLRRYSLLEAAKLLRGRLRWSESIGGIAAATGVIIAIAMFFTQHAPRIQAAIQSLAFVLLVIFSPRVFSLLLPRALFGTLGAWIMVVLAHSASLLPMTSKEAVAAQRYCHVWLVNVMHPVGVNSFGYWVAQSEAAGEPVAPPAIVSFLSIFFACLLISYLFLMIEVRGRLAAGIAGRSVACVLVMLGGSLFWGAMLVPTLTYIVAPLEFPGSFCACRYPAWVLGSVFAVAFGILVQLMWDDHAVADSFGQPGEASRTA